MAWQTIRDEVQTVLNGVSSLGKVHDRIRLIRNDSDLTTIGVETAGIINLWMHSWAGYRQPALTNAEKMVTHVWRIQGFYSFDDAAATEATFFGMLADIQNAFDSDLTLNGAAELIELPEWLEDNQPHGFLPPGDGGKLVHMATLRMLIHERLTRS